MKKILLILILLLLTGCSDYNELSDINVVSSCLLDKNNSYSLTVEYLDKDDIKTITCKSNDLSTTFDECDNLIDTHLLYSHINAIFITDDINLNELIDYTMRNPRFNNNYYLVNVDNTNIYNETNIGKKYAGILSSQNIDNFFNIMIKHNNKKTYELPTLIDDDILLKVINNDKSVILDSYNTNTYKMINNNSNVIKTTKLDEGIISYKIEDVVKKNNTFYIKASIKELTKNIDTTKVSNIKYLEDAVSDSIKGEITYLYSTLSKNKIIKNNNDINVSVHLFKKGFILK